MITLKLAFSFCLLFISLTAFAQGGFTYEVKRAVGDFNKDSLEDLAIVTQDTTADTKPYRLQIFFKQPDGKYKLIVSTVNAIGPALPDGKNGYNTGDNFDDIAIVDGVIIIGVQLLRGHYEHKFRYQNGNFELIGFSISQSDGNGTCGSTDFNLSTGIRLEKEERCDIDKIIRNIRRKVVIRPLPKLQKFQPLQSELY